MPQFEYLARSTNGEQVAGTLQAANRQEALRTLVAQELFPVRVVERRQGWWSWGTGRVPGKYLAAFYTQLADLLRAGVPLLRSLQILQRQMPHGGFQEVLDQICQDVAQGRPLAAAMQRHQQLFGPVAVSMVRAGEEGGFVEDVLRRIGRFLEHQQELKSRTLAALVYPAFLLVVGVAVVVGMLGFFVPKFEPIFERFAQIGQLPWATRALLGSSQVLQQHWPVFVLAVAGVVWAGVQWSRRPSGRQVLDRLWLRLPGVGNIVRTMAVARFCRILGTLLRSGVPVLRALQIAQDATGNQVLAQAVAQAAEQVAQGRSLAGPLKASGEFPADVVEMIAVAEEANTLESVLAEVAETMERRTARVLDTLVRLLEPVLLVLMAGMVLFVVVALLGPILQSSSFL